MVQVDYVREEGAYDLAQMAGEGKPHPVTGGPSDTAFGDFDSAFNAAPVQLDETYTTPDQAHSMPAVSAVTMARTPGAAFAASRSIPAMRPFAMAAPTTKP